MDNKQKQRGERLRVKTRQQGGMKKRQTEW